MIQRIQTIYLLLAFGLTVLLLVFPLFLVNAVSNTNEAATISAEFGANGFVFTQQIENMDQRGVQYGGFGLLGDSPEIGKIPVYISYIIMALFTMAAVFSYKRRKAQILFCRLNLVLNILFTVGVVAFYYIGTAMIKEEMPVDADVTVTFGLGLGFYFLIATVPFLMLALRGIKHDENLVKSLDRLR